VPVPEILRFAQNDSFAIMIDNQLNTAIESARAAAERGDFAAAVETQECVVTHMRVKAQSADDLVALSAQMFNLADYYTGVERFDDAIRLLEEVVALDERMSLPDAESDRQTLEQARRLAVMTPDERKRWYANTPAGLPTATAMPDEMTQLLNQLDGVDAVDRAELEVLMRQLAGLSPEEQVKKVMEIRKRSGGHAPAVK
jgi:hypothetical protein